jgi:uncharacterized protein YeaO (DUF488 family)
MRMALCPNELESNPALPDVLGRIGKGKSTLLYAAKDPAINRAVVHAELLSRSRLEKPRP